MSSEHELSRKDCHCLKSLDLAVWTDQGRIKADAKEKLKVLFE